MKQALTTGQALLIEKPLTLDCGLLPPQTHFSTPPSNKIPRKLTPAEIREREWFFFDEDNWIEFSIENLPNHSFTLFNNSNQKPIYHGQLDSRGHVYVKLEPDVKYVDIVFDQQTTHRAWYQDVPLQILGGLRDAGQSTLNLLWDSTLINPVSPLFFARVQAEIISDKPIGEAPNPLQLPQVSPPETIAGALTHGVSQFLVGFIPMFKASKFIRPLQKMGSWGKGMIAGSVTDFVVFNPHEERLSNLIQQFPELANPVTEYLQAKPDDKAAEGRLKNSLEGLLIGSLAEPLTRSLRLLKYARIKITATEVRTKVHYKIDTVTVELDEVNWNNVVEKGATTPTPPIKINIANDFTKSPQSIWGRSADDIAKDLQAAGYQVNIRQSTRGSGQAVIIEVKDHPEISQIQIHPGGGRHGGSYYKVSTTTQGTIKVVDPNTYKPSVGERATIINKPKE